MKIIVAGSRDITDYKYVRLAFIQSGYWKQYKHSIEIVSGTARGVDRLGEVFAERNGLTVHRFPADWEKHGRAAGHIRNRQMADFVAQHGGLLLALWDGKSPGTKGMIDYAKSVGVNAYIMLVGEQEKDEPL